MLQITVIVRLTGLLLMVPDAVVPGAAPAKLPMHVLMPAEGPNVPPHVATLGWRSLRSDCRPPYVWQRLTGPLDPGVCWVSLEGWSVDIGAAGEPTNPIPLPRAAVLLGAPEPGATPPSSPATHLVDRRFLDGNRPGRELRARVNLLSGFIDHECGQYKWDFDAEFKTYRDQELTSVLTWQFQTRAPIDSLVRTELLDDSASTPGRLAAPRRSAIHLPALSGDTLELFVAYMPLDEYLGTPQPAVQGLRAAHLHAFYDLLGFTPGVPRSFPALLRKINRCDFVKTPGSPTCVMNTALPQ